MQQRRWSLMVFGVACLGAIGGLLGAVTGPAAGQVKASKVTVVNVTIGKPTELAFTLSKSSNLPAGTLTFKVKNAGHGSHDFEICTTAVPSASKNACVGKTTKLLTSGQSTTLTVTLMKIGKYEFLCAVPGHAAAGMKGILGVGVSVAAAAAVSVTTPSVTTTPAATTPAPTPTTTTAAGGGGGGATGADGCPPGKTIVTAGFGGDGDADDDGSGPSDGDGCL